MKCLYCPKEVVIIVDDGYPRKGLCTDCQASYYFNKDGQVCRMTWNNIIIRGREYWVRICPLRVPHRGETLFRIVYAKPSDKKSQNGLPTYSTKLLMKFDFIPKNWTPHNAVEKITTYLPFL